MAHPRGVTAVLLVSALGVFWPLEVRAECEVPHVITNGQVADATAVMENFYAIAACTDEAVKPMGSPTTGSLAVFSSSTSVTSGNLTGDVTTSGGTSTTLSASGVTAGTYVNPTLVVDSKGRVTAAVNGGSGGATPAYFLIETKVADGTGASITFNSIPQIYRDLIIVITGQSVSPVQDLLAYANGDTTNANYRNQTWNRFGTGSVAAPRIGTLVGAGVPSSGTATQITATFPSYSSTIWKKNATCDSQYEDESNFFRSICEWKWNNLSAITQISFQISSGNISNGSVFSLYGRGMN